MATDAQVTIERTYDAPIEVIWDLWTTKDGIEGWWAPDGFVVDVQTMDLRPGGELIYTMTAVGAAQVEFMKQAGLPLTTQSRKRFTAVTPTERLAYSTLADFIPDVEPYEFDTTVDLTSIDDSTTKVVMTVDKMHDDQWTIRLVAGRENELQNLERLLALRRWPRPG